MYYVLSVYGNLPAEVSPPPYCAVTAVTATTTSAASNAVLILETYSTCKQCRRASEVGICSKRASFFAVAALCALEGPCAGFIRPSADKLGLITMLC